MHRFFIEYDDLSGDMIPLRGDVLHHLRTVLRLTAGEEILLLDGTGYLCRCRVEELGKEGGVARVMERTHEREGTFPLRLMQGIPKGDKMDLILQKGTELGISLFAPVQTVRSVPRLSPDREETRLRRWRRIVVEAARQSRRPCLPPLAPPMDLSAALENVTEELRLMLWEGATLPLAEILPDTPPKSAALLVGPEGGFTDEEAEIARKSGFIPVSLGPRILRTETAGFAVSATLQFLYGDMGSRPRLTEEGSE